MSALQPERFPPRHQLHKYWGKKPANVMRALVERHTEAGARVLDPFAGSGVTVIEAERIGRRAIGVELNPVAVRIGSLLLDPPLAARVLEEGRAIVDALSPLSRALYGARCAKCGGSAELRSHVWAGAVLARVSGACASCGAKIDRAATPADRRAAHRRVEIPPHPDAPLPRAWQMRKLVRAGLTRMSQLFTDRNRAMLAHLHAAIESRALEPRVREALRLTFTANLAQCSRMIADYRGRAGGPSWKINCYWLPKRWQELNVLAYFENRLVKTARALEDAVSTGRGTSEILRGDARALPLRRASIDYVLTDPPYGGEGIQYGELSFLWNLWLGETAELEREIAFNPLRQKTLEDYARDLGEAFAECRRVLRKGGSMTVAFNNRDERVWRVLLDACTRAGFTKLDETAIARSAPALTERIARRAPKTDVLLHFTPMR